MLTNQFNIFKLRFVNVQTGRLKILKRYFEVVVQKTDKYNSRKKKALKDKEQSLKHYKFNQKDSIKMMPNI